jgi:REP element-mobilizing transposase RayT
MVLNKYGKIVEEEWLMTKEIRMNVELDYYVVMPNHFHGIINKEQTTDNKNITNVGATRRVAQIPVERAIQRIAPTKEKLTLQSGSLGAIIGQFKSKVTKRIIIEGNREFKWQRNYYEHIIRNDTDLYNIRRYIELNPLKWELDEYYKT